MRTRALHRIAALALPFVAGHAAADTFTVTSTADSGPGSLRAAILAANALQVTGGTACAGHRIVFAIPGSGVQTIRPTSALPRIDIQIEFDGYSQPGASRNTLSVGSNAVLLVEIDGSLAGNVDAFVINALPGGPVICAGSGSRFTGLVINRFAGAAISMGEQSCPAGLTCTVGGVRIDGNHIGTDPAGLVAQGNGIVLNRPALLFGRFSSTNIVGEQIRADGGAQSPTPGNRNVISGNGQDGIRIGGDSSAASALNHRIRNNYIGVDAQGTGLLPNARHGIAAIGFSNTNHMADNVVSGNGGHGILVGDGPPGGTSLDGNAVGMTVAGEPAGNALAGVRIFGMQAGHSVARRYPFLPAGLPSIAYNGGAGISIEDSAIVDLVAPSVARNVGLDVDLAPVGPNPNDAGDPDSGPNERLNYPVIDAATFDVVDNVTTVQGTFNGRPNTQHELYFFSNDACHPSGYGGALAPLAPIGGPLFQRVTTDAMGNASFSANMAPLPAGRAVTALARRFADSGFALEVSELAACRSVVSLSPLIFLDGFEP